MFYFTPPPPPPPKKNEKQPERISAFKYQKFPFKKRNILLYLCDEDDMLAAKLLFQLSDKSVLDFLEAPELWHWDKDDDSLLDATNLDFL